MIETGFTSNDIQRLYSEHEEKLESYAELLLWWNSKLNLVSRDVSRETLKKHIEHSLTLAPFLTGSKTVLDTGTGGGLPGIPLAICSSGVTYILNDIQLKKGAALRQMVFDLGLNNVTPDIKDISQVRIENRVLVVSKHAFKLDYLIPAMSNINWSELIMLKGLDDVVQELNYFSDIKAQVIDLYDLMKDEWYKGKGILRLANPIIERNG